MEKIKFIGIGAVKSGTTWLADNMRLHPEIFLPEDKGVNYFNPSLPNEPGKTNPRHNKPLHWYHGYYSKAGPGQIKGEFAPAYMRVEDTAEHILQYNRSIKLFAVLRRPVEQVFSLYRFLKQYGQLKDISFFDALEKHSWIREAGNFGSQLKPYYERFPKEQIKVLLFDEVISSPQVLFDEACAFVGAKKRIPLPSPGLKNVTGKTKNKSVSKLMFKARGMIAQPAFSPLEKLLKKSGALKLGERIHRKNINVTLPKEGLDDDEKKRLLDEFIDEIELTERLTGIDLSNWKRIEA